MSIILKDVYISRVFTITSNVFRKNILSFKDPIFPNKP